MPRFETADEFRRELLAAELLVPLSVDGLYARSREFDMVVRALGPYASRTAVDLDPVYFAFPAVMPRSWYERTGYVRSFPTLLGSVSVFRGDDRDHATLIRAADSGGDWAADLVPSEVTLCSAACQQVYGLMTGTVPQDGRVVEVDGQVFRHEPSTDPTRMLSFSIHEFVYLGTPDGASRYRDGWVDRGRAALQALGLSVRPDVANDPFFGRPAKLLANRQREEELKIELVIDISAERPTAIASANRHLEHFSAAFGISTPDGALAHSACFGFGVERVALALFAQHGLKSDSWPPDVRQALDLDPTRRKLT